MKPQTIEATSKVIKFQLAVSFMMILVGMIAAASLYSSGKSAGIWVPVVITGLIWNIAMRISKWWNHG